MYRQLCLAIVLLAGEGGEGGDVTRVEGVDRVEGGKGGGENTIMTECTQKSAYLVEGLWHT